MKPKIPEAYSMEDRIINRQLQIVVDKLNSKYDFDDESVVVDFHLSSTAREILIKKGYRVSYQKGMDNTDRTVISF